MDVKLSAKFVVLKSDRTDDKSVCVGELAICLSHSHVYDGENVHFGLVCIAPLC